MKLTQAMSLEEFRDEMQVRVFKHDERSKPVLEAMRFARQHSDPAFYRVAVGKVAAQKQFRHETYGPSRWQRLADFLGGTPKDVSVTLFLIVAVLAGLSFMRSRVLESADDAVSDIDVDRLAERMGLYMTRHAPPAHDPQHWIEPDKTLAQRFDEEIELADVDAAVTEKLHDVIDRSGLGDVATRKLNEELSGDALRGVVAKQLEHLFNRPEVQEALVRPFIKQLDESVRDRVATEVERAVSEAGIEREVARRIEEQIVRLDEQLAARNARLATEVQTAIKKGVESARLDLLVAERIEVYAKQLDSRLAAFDKRLAERMEEIREEMRKAKSTARDPLQNEAPTAPDGKQSASVGR